MRHFDAIIVGTGQAGPFLAGRLTKAGQTVAIVERKRFGGTCVNTGCIPTKTLVASARAAWMVARAGDFGVQIDGTFRVDMQRVKQRKDAVAGSASAGVEKWLRSMDRCTVIQGHARFTAPAEVAVGDERFTAERIFLNVGRRAAIPAIEGLDQVPYLTNSSMMAVDFLPEHLLVLGAGAVGLEFAQMYRRFGSRVTLINRTSRLAEEEDEDVSEAIRSFLEKEGIEMVLDAKVSRAARRGNEIVLELQSHASAEVVGSHLLLATGRRPNTDDLNLAVAGIEVDSRGYIKVDEGLRTSAENVWAMGDCNGRGAFTHTAYNDFEIVAANLLDGEHRRVSDRITAYAIYTDPPLGRAGMNKRQARELVDEVLIAHYPMSKVGRAREKGETEGFMEALIDAKTNQILGATILGTGGDEVIHTFLDMMYAGAPYQTMQRAMHIHPTVAELIPTMLADLQPLGSTAEVRKR